MKRISLAFMALLLLSTSIHAQVSTDSLSKESYIQRKHKLNPVDNFKTISLGEVIEQGLRRNFGQEIRNYENKILEIDWKDTKDAFWLPKFELNLSSGPHQITKLKGDTNDNLKKPAGTLGLSLGEYTLFNWGKDYIGFLNSKSTYNRTKDTLWEKRRELRQELIASYFELYTYKSIEETYKDQLRKTSYIYTLNKERVKQKRTSREEYYQSRAEYLRAQHEYHLAKMNSEVADESIAKLISDEAGVRYTLTEELKFEPINMTVAEAARLSKNNSPVVLDATTEVNLAKRNYDLTLKENLALPKFTMDLGAYQHKFGSNYNRTNYENKLGGSGLEVVATINATWTILGPGGLFNSRKSQKGLLEKHKAYTNLAKARHDAHSYIRQSFKRILHYENQIKILSAMTENLDKNFDTTLDKYIKKKTSFANLKHVVEELTQYKVKLKHIKFYHMKEKIELAKTIGVEDLPGKNFEKLAIKKFDATKQKIEDIKDGSN